MSILCSTKAISIITIILAVNHLDISVFNVFFIFIIDIFYLSGESSFIIGWVGRHFVAKDLQ